MNKFNIKQAISGGILVVVIWVASHIDNPLIIILLFVAGFITFLERKNK